MKKMKKLATLLLAVCLMVPCFSMLSYAARGEVQFTDPSTAVGETVEVTVAVKTDDGTIEDVKIDMQYDTSMLKFKEGDGVTETTAGQLSYAGTGSSSVLRFKLYFDVLKEGTTSISVNSTRAWLDTDEEIDCSNGSSTITIAAGETPAVTDEPDVTTDPNTTAAVEVDDVTYTLSGNFAEADIPAGFVESTLDYDGAQHRVVYQESSGIYLGYLVDAESNGKFFMYVSEDATFAPFEQITVSDTTTIMILSNVENIVLPEQYAATTVSVNGQNFPAWQDKENTDMCIVYAVNNKGEESLYQLDSYEGTYQRFEAPAIDTEEENDSFIGKLSAVLEDHLDYVILGTGIGFIVFVVLIIVLSVKLYNRNAELDEIYDEYGIDLDDDDEEDEDGITRITDDEEDDEDESDEESFEDEEDLDEDESDVEVEFFEQQTSETAEVLKKTEEIGKAEIETEGLEAALLKAVGETEIKKEPDTAVKIDEDEFYDDDDELDFEMDFIDLDD